jgi:predicted RNA-binding Zn-ribbon protein involved in translation (DUF1610 family)
MIDPNIAYRDRNKPTIPHHSETRWIWEIDKILRYTCGNCEATISWCNLAGEIWKPNEYICPACSFIGGHWVAEDV